MKLFKQNRYVRKNHVQEFIILTGILLLFTIKSELHLNGLTGSHLTVVKNELSASKKTKKKRTSKKPPVKDLISIKKEEFRKLEVRILEKETKLKSYESIAPDVHFSIQIFASRKEIKTSELQARFGLSNEIKVEFVNGWFKYTTGYFIKYWKAREYRKKLISKHFIYDAFVVAFQAGKRIALNTLVSPEEWKNENIKILSGKLLPVKAGKYSIRFLRINNLKIPVDTIKEIYGLDEEIYCQYANGTYHYISGIYDSYSEAAKVRNKMRIEGNRDALVIGKNLFLQNPGDDDFLSEDFKR